MQVNTDWYGFWSISVWSYDGLKLTLDKHIHKQKNRLECHHLPFCRQPEWRHLAHWSAPPRVHTILYDHVTVFPQRVENFHPSHNKQKYGFNFDRDHRMSRCYVDWSTLSKASNMQMHVPFVSKVTAPITTRIMWHIIHKLSAEWNIWYV